MTRRAHFRVVAQLDSAGQQMPGKVTITPQFFTVRPLRRRRTYELPLSALATFVCQHITKIERRERAKTKRRRG